MHFPSMATSTAERKRTSIANNTSATIFNTGGLLMGKNLRRKNQQIFRVDDDELNLIHEKMKMANIRSKERYFRKMVLDGYVIRTDFSDVRETIRLLSNSSNNLNQISKRVNSTGNIYADDIKDIEDNYELLWEQIKIMLDKFIKLPD